MHADRGFANSRSLKNYKSTFRFMYKICYVYSRDGLKKNKDTYLCSSRSSLMLGVSGRCARRASQMSTSSPSLPTSTRLCWIANCISPSSSSRLYCLLSGPGAEGRTLKLLTPVADSFNPSVWAYKNLPHPLQIFFETQMQS